LAALPRALVAGFVKTDKEFQEKSESTIAQSVRYLQSCYFYGSSSYLWFLEH